MSTDYNKNELVSAGTLDLMFREFAGLMFDPSLSRPQYDENTGRYTNISIANWLDNYADGLVYGVQMPRYSHDPGIEAVKTGANAGLVLEPSTTEVSGRNDYDGRKLFMCPRVNGGVDVDGTNYVTAIEGYDNRFDPGENTYVLTPIYYVRRTEIETDGAVTHDLNEFTDTPRAGFDPCIGAFKANGEEREFILRACYMDSDGAMSSRAGEVPSSYYPDQKGTMFFNHSCLDEFIVTQTNTENGLTFFTYGDMTYLLDFMQLMLGVKAPKNVASGQRAYSVSGTCRVGETDTTHVVVNASDAAKFEVGMTVAVGTTATRNRATTHSIVPHATLIAKNVRDNDAYIDLELDVSDPFTTTTATKIMNMSWINGCLDGVRGTYGSFTEEALVNTSNKNAAHRWPFKFQNMEWMTGLSVIIQNMRNVLWMEDIDGVSTQVNQICIAPDISSCLLEYTEDPETGEITYTGFIHPQGMMKNPDYIDGQTTPDEPEFIPNPNDPEDLIGVGWETPAHGRWEAPASNWYIEDYKTADGAGIPTQGATGTSTTGYMVRAYSTTGDKVEKQVYGFGHGLNTYSANAAYYGVGYFHAYSALGYANASASHGGRSSCIGYSSRSDE